MRDIRRIDLNLLVALEALLEEESVTRAADRLALTQPTVSAMLARLRKLFGDPLFVRTPRGILPTPRAAALAPKLKQWLAEARALVVETEFDPATAELTASVSANDYIQSALLVPFMQRLRREAPNARLGVRAPQPGDVAAVLADAGLDLCITTTPEIPDTDLRSRRLYSERYVCVVRSGHPLRARAAPTLDQFCRYPHAMVSPTEGCFVGPVDRALADVGRRRRVVLSAPGFLTLPEILKTDDLIAVVPERVLRGRMDGLRTFAAPVDVPGFDVVMLWHERQHQDPAHRWLRELLATTADELRREPVARKPRARR
ncbi:MAG TPA: LysR family transcriptional regulator [Rhodanobacteraceae bacterium]|nr:LysR family transcriptional regulator [Rhodanobacteraceae bacterium]